MSIERSAAKFAARLAVYKPIFALLVKRTHVGVAISNDYLTLAEPVTGAVFESFFFFGLKHVFQKSTGRQRLPAAALDRILSKTDDLGGIVGAVSLEIEDARDYWEGELTRVMTIFKSNREKSFRLYAPSESQDSIPQPLELCLWSEWDGQEKWDTDRHGLLGKFGHFIGRDNQTMSSNTQTGDRTEGLRQLTTVSPMVVDSGAEASFRATAFLQVFLDHLGSENTFG